MTQPQRPKAQANDRTQRLRAIARSPSSPEFSEDDDEPTKPGVIPSSPPARASNWLTSLFQQTLPLLPPNARLPALALLLASALAAYWLYAHS